jgi:hypothetical protein
MPKPPFLKVFAVLAPDKSGWLTREHMLYPEQTERPVKSDPELMNWDTADTLRKRHKDVTVHKLMKVLD